MPLYYFPVPTTLTDATPVDAGWVYLTPDQLSLVQNESRELVLQKCILHPRDLDTLASELVSDLAYNATDWNGVTTIAPSKNAVRDKIETIVSSISGLGTMSAQNANAVAITGGTILLPLNANNSDIRISGLEFQGASATSALLMENIYYDGADFRYRTTAAAAGIHFNGDEIHFMRAASGTAGNSAGTFFTIPKPLIITSTAATFAVDVVVPDEAYDATNWNGVLEAPTKNAVRDKFESLPTLDAGTYTPTLDNTTNVSSSSAYQCQYMRIGATVNVSGRVDLTSTGVGDTVLGISLPVASNIGAVEDVAGVAANDDSSSFTAGCIRGNAAGDRAELYWYASSGSSRNVYFTFTYQVI